MNKIETITAMFLAGETPKEVAAKFGCTPDYVTRVVSKNTSKEQREHIYKARRVAVPKARPARVPLVGPASEAKLNTVVSLGLNLATSPLPEWLQAEPDELEYED